MCQEGETWDFGQSQFFDAHLFNGSQFYIGSSFLHLFSNLLIIFWPTQIGQCMKKRGLNMQKDKRLSGLDLAPVGASIIESCRSSAPSCITRAAVTAGSEGSGGCRGDVGTKEGSSCCSCPPELYWPGVHLPQHNKLQMAGLICLAFSKSGCSYFWHAAQHIIRSCSTPYLWSCCSVGCGLAVWINIPLPSLPPTYPTPKPMQRGLLQLETYNAVDLPNLIHNTCLAVLRGEEGSDALGPHHPPVQRDHLMTAH